VEGGREREGGKEGEEGRETKEGQERAIRREGEREGGRHTFAALGPMTLTMAWGVMLLFQRESKKFLPKLMSDLFWWPGGGTGIPTGEARTSLERWEGCWRA
jgi:hypothetical protein